MTTSYNGWQASQNRAAIGVDKNFKVNLGSGLVVGFPGGVKAGDVAYLFTYLVTQFHNRVEAIDLPSALDEWGYNYRQNRNSNNLSCHSSGTALDLNATRHPNNRGRTFKPAQVQVIKAILAELGGVIGWGGDFNRTKDEMHFEIKGNAAQVKAVVDGIKKRLLAAKKPSTWENDMGGTPHSGIQPSKQPEAKTLISHVQYCLDARGYEVRRDGIWDAACEKALRVFQAQRNLASDGKVGGITWRELHTPQ